MLYEVITQRYADQLVETVPVTGAVTVTEQRLDTDADAQLQNDDHQRHSYNFV